MHSSILLMLSALAASAFAGLLNKCTAQTRLKYADQVIQAYAATTNAETFSLFNTIPFGVPDLDGVCTTVIRPNGGSPVPVGFTGHDVVNFGTATRQLFSSVTGQYVDFPQNGTALINTNVTLGVRSNIPVPVTFTGHVFLDYNADCRIYAVRAYAQIPTQLLGYVVDFDWLSLPDVPL